LRLASDNPMAIACLTLGEYAVGDHAFGGLNGAASCTGTVASTPLVIRPASVPN